MRLLTGLKHDLLDLIERDRITPPLMQFGDTYHAAVRYEKDTLSIADVGFPRCPTLPQQF